MAKTHLGGGFEGPGEHLTALYIRDHLPAGWDVIFNKEVPRQNSSREVDAIVVAEHAIFVIEEKHWHGRIAGNEARWILDSGETRKSPLNQVKQANQSVQAFLGDQIPGFADRFVRGNQKAIEGFVLMSAPCVVEVNDPRTQRWVLALEGCETFFLEEDNRHQRQSIADLRDTIVARLTLLKDQPKIPSRINVYQILEVEREGNWISSFRAVHDNGEERILRLIWKPEEIEEETYARKRTALLREYDALSRLRDSGIVPRVHDWFEWDDGRAWVVPLDPPSGRSLRAVAIVDQPSEMQLRLVLPEAFEALATLHEAGVIHRGITPDRTFVSEGDTVSFIDLLVARIPQLDSSIGPMVAELDPDNEYRAPECAGDPSLASRSSDVYSLTATLLSWMTDTEPDDESWPPNLATERLDLPRALALALNDLLTRGIDPDHTRRPSAPELRDLLAVACGTRQATRFAPGTRLDNDRYKVVEELGHGATAVTYLAEDSARHGAKVVLKQIVNPDLVPLALAEYEALKPLQHDNLVEVIDVYPIDHQFHLKLEYVPGSALADLMQLYRGHVDRVLDVALELADALSYLAERNQVHRDISPKNIMVPDDESLKIKIIDFALSKASGTTSLVGTPRYRAPEAEQSGAWQPTCDLYSVAVVLFEMLTGRTPYELEEGMYPHKDSLVDLESLNLVGRDRAVAEVLLTQASPAPEKRYPGALEFANALRAAAAGLTPGGSTDDGDELVNPWVDEIRGLYRNSRIGNSDNRGLDSGFARETYVSTALDDRLLPDLLDGGMRLLILSGNPGDGKTAFLARVLDAARERGAEDIVEDEAGWRARVDGRGMAAVYDASESHGPLSADDLVRGCLSPLAGEAQPDGSFTAMLAINDGRLLEFFERFGPSEYPWLWGRIEPQLTEGGPQRDGVVLVDLKRRALSGGSGIPLFERLLDPLVATDKWSICEGCAARTECPILFNALSLRPDLDAVRSQLNRLLTAVHLRRERRPTIRDLRSALAYLLTQDLSCLDVHEERRSKLIPLSTPGRPYFNAVFSGDGGPDLLLDQWSLLDPVIVPSAGLDRFLHFHRQPWGFPKVERLFAPIDGRAPSASLGSDEESWFRSMKRRYMFEGRHDAEDGLPDPDTLLAYRSLPAFRAALVGEVDDDALVDQLLMSIGRADGVPLSAASEGLALRTREDDDLDQEVVVIKRFPTSEFRIERGNTEDSYIESVPDQLSLVHRDGHPRLAIGLDLFEFLSRTAEGLAPGADEHRSLFEDLATFKHQLLTHPTERVSISEGGRRIHEIAATAGSLDLKGAS